MSPDNPIFFLLCKPPPPPQSRPLPPSSPSATSKLGYLVRCRHIVLVLRLSTSCQNARVANRGRTRAHKAICEDDHFSNEGPITAPVPSLTDPTAARVLWIVWRIFLRSAETSLTNLRVDYIDNPVLFSGAKNSFLNPVDNGQFVKGRVLFNYSISISERIAARRAKIVSGKTGSKRESDSPSTKAFERQQ